MTKAVRIRVSTSLIQSRRNFRIFSFDPEKLVELSPHIPFRQPRFELNRRKTSKKASDSNLHSRYGRHVKGGSIGEEIKKWKNQKNTL